MVEDLHLGHLHRCGDRIVHERRGDQLSIIVVDELFVERSSESLRDPSVQLTFYHHGVHDKAAVVDGRILHQLHLPGLDIDFHEGEVGHVRIRWVRAYPPLLIRDVSCVRSSEVSGRFESRLDVDRAVVGPPVDDLRDIVEF